MISASRTFGGDRRSAEHLRTDIIHISGLSLDQQTVSAVSRVRLSEREEESMSCFLRACDAALSYLQDLEKVSL